MAEMNNYFNGNYGTAEEAAEQEKQQKMTADVLTASSGMMHANFGSYVAGSGERIISGEKFNTYIGLMLLYGFAVNAILCFVLTDWVLAFMEKRLILVIVMYFGGLFIGSAICNRAKSAVVGFIGYNIIILPMGIFLTPFFASVGFETVRYAFCVMGVCMLLMIGLAQVYPSFFKSIGRMLFTCLIIGIIGEVIMWCVNLSSGILDFIFIGIFLGYIGLDWARAQEEEKTVNSAIRCAYMIYVDLINLLLRLIRIIAKNRD